MSDYLNNLAARSLSLAPVVQPRLASLFEPPSVPAATTTDQSLREIDAVREQPMPGETLARIVHLVQPGLGELQPPSAARFPATGLDHQPRTKGGADDRPGIEHGNRLVPQSAPHSTSVASQPLAVVVPQLAALASEAKTGRRLRDDAPVLEPRINRQRDAPPATDAKQEIWSRFAENLQPIGGEPLASFGRPPSHDRSRAEPVSARLPGTSMSIRLPERQEPAVIKPSVRVRDKPMLTTEPGPTIRITIGRVDVRAVMPERPAPRPAPERRNLALSLEDYLKQRSGGKL